MSNDQARRLALGAQGFVEGRATGRGVTAGSVAVTAAAVTGAVAVGGAIGYGTSRLPVIGGGTVADYWGDVIFDAFYAGQGERSWEKGRGDDWMWDLTIDELRAIENDPNSTPEEKARAKKIRKQKEKKKKC
jgi:hypothetical protein